MQAGAQTRGWFGCYRRITKLFAINYGEAWIYRDREQILIRRGARDLTFDVLRWITRTVAETGIKGCVIKF